MEDSKCILCGGDAQIEKIMKPDIKYHYNCEHCGSFEVSGELYELGLPKDLEQMKRLMSERVRDMNKYDKHAQIDSRNWFYVLTDDGYNKEQQCADYVEKTPNIRGLIV